MAAGRAGERVAERVVPQVMERGGLPAEMLGAMAQRTQSPATVFHGSPHLFQRFDASKIGTGEGAQAYGHGLYFAESPDVARQYARQLTDIGGGPVKMDTSSMIPRARYGTVDEGLEANEKLLAQLKSKASKGDESAKKQIPAIESKIKSIAERAKVYQVDLPDEQIARMIDWNKPLSEQSKEVQEAVAKLRDVPLASGDRTVGGELFEGATGMDLMMALKKTNPETFFGPRYGAQSSEMLRQAGIPGIRYLDQGSRGAGQGTSNFVVFPGMEDMLRIEQINEQPIQSLFQTLGR
jgi:hypothetical protein